MLTDNLLKELFEERNIHLGVIILTVKIVLKVMFSLLLVLQLIKIFQKKSPDFGKMCPFCVHPWVKISFKCILRVS